MLRFYSRYSETELRLELLSAEELATVEGHIIEDVTRLLDVWRACVESLYRGGHPLELVSLVTRVPMATLREWYPHAAPESPAVTDLCTAFHGEELTGMTRLYVHAPIPDPALWIMSGAPAPPGHLTLISGDLKHGPAKARAGLTMPEGYDALRSQLARLLPVSEQLDEPGRRALIEHAEKLLSVGAPEKLLEVGAGA